MADWSETISFTTESLPGDCPLGTTASDLMMEDFDGGTLPPDWSTAGSSGTVTWVASTDQAHSGSHSMFAQNVGSVTGPASGHAINQRSGRCRQRLPEFPELAIGGVVGYWLL